MKNDRKDRWGFPFITFHGVHMELISSIKWVKFNEDISLKLYHKTEKQA